MTSGSREEVTVCELQDVAKDKGGASVVVMTVEGCSVETGKRCLERIERLSNGWHRYHPSQHLAI